MPVSSFRVSGCQFSANQQYSCLRLLRLPKLIAIQAVKRILLNSSYQANFKYTSYILTEALYSTNS